MANANAITLDNLAPPVAWRAADARARREFLEFARVRAVATLRAQLVAGRDRYGARLKPVLPTSRPDGADGPPLTPHDEGSRSQKWIRSQAAPSRRGVTLWWSHGWGAILGYHGDGLVRGAPVRDVRGLAPGRLRTLRRECRAWWDARGRPARVSTPAKAPAPAKAPESARADSGSRAATRAIKRRYPDIKPYLS